MDTPVIKQRVDELLLPAMERAGISSWLILTQEYNPDPLARDVGGDRITDLGALFFCVNKGKLERHALVVGFDVDPLAATQVYDKVESYSGYEFWPKLNKLISEFNPKRIAINCSETTNLADGLSSGLYMALQKYLDQVWKSRLVTSEDLVIGFRSRRIAGEVESLRKAAMVTEGILRKTLSREFITPGKTTERQLANAINEEIKRLGVGHTWNQRANPIINTGLLRGHSFPSDRVIQPGHIVNVGCGIVHKGLCSDLQRSLYVLKHVESEPPKEIIRLFTATRKAIDLAVEAIKPGVRGVDIDKIARQAIINEGFPSYTHATGHPIGYDVHDLGPYIGPDWPEIYGQKIYLPFEVDQVFCVEPAAIFNWPEMKGDVEVGLKDEVVVTSSKAEYLTIPQTVLWVIDGW